MDTADRDTIARQGAQIAALKQTLTVLAEQHAALARLLARGHTLRSRERNP